VSIEPIAAPVAAFLAIYALFVLGLLLIGRRDQARALAGFVPDCIVLFRRLLGDERVPRSRKLSLVLLLGYLALPIDLIPDFIPVAGQLDDAILVAVALRFVLRGDGPPVLEQHWPGPDPGLRLIRAIAFGPRGRDEGFSRTS
jgi:uncharacterized membrane protein YkvA (DUF1232 family)